MKPVDQTRFGEPAGNCYAACIASILERPLEEFDHRPETQEPAGWGDSWQTYMNMRGLGLVEVEVKTTIIIPRSLYYIASGPSPRGNYEHAVVHLNGKLAHDPHPDRTGLEKVTWVIFIVPLVGVSHR